MEGEPAETVIPLLEEHLRIARRRRETGRVRVSVTTGEETRMVEEVLRNRSVEVERVPVGRPVAEAPPVREEGDTLVIPVLEEVLVVERRLVLREEVRVRLRTEERRETAPVTLRRQEAAIERLPPETSPEAPNQQEAHGMRTITGLFDSRPDAERAVEYMVQHHDIDRNRIQVHAAGTENATAGTHERRDESHHGFVASLQDLGLPEQDSITYAEGMRRGGILVSVQAPDDKLDQVADAFESNGAVDLDAREAEWRQGGWTGGGGGLIGGKSAGSSATPDSMPAVNPDARQAGWTGGGGAIGSTASGGEGTDAAGPSSTYAGTSYIGARATDEDITKPVNAGIASSPAVRPAGPAALAAAGAGASTSALRGSAADARRAASEGFDGPGSGEGPAPGSAAAGDQPLPSREGPTSPGGHGTGIAATQGLSSGTVKPSDALQSGRAGLQTGGTGSAAAHAGSTAPQTTGVGAAGRDQAIPIIEERLRVGKRDVSYGRVRVRSYVVETPVEEQVRLREEHVQVERRPVDRPLGAADEAGFQDRVIEATELAEEAVIDKEARVREEVVIRKDATERTETVSDTVRRTEVEVEDERRRTAGTTPRDPGR